MPARKKVKKKPARPVKRAKSAAPAKKQVSRQQPETLRLRSASPSTVNDIQKSLA
jgi:hypothetical protein